MTLETTHRHVAQNGATVVPSPSEAVTQAIHEWVSGLGVAMQGAEYIVDTPACPDSFWPLPSGVKAWNIPDKNPKLRLPDESEESFGIRRRIAAQTAGFVVRYGLGLGLAPEVALNGIFIIGGRPSMYSEQMVALVKSHGHGHQVIERTAESCTIQVKHRNDDEWQRFTFTMDDAIQAGYVPGKGPNEGKDQWGKDRKGGNAKYLTDPKTMLHARVSSIACKIVFPDVLRGMASFEEVQDDLSLARDDEEDTPPKPTTAASIRERLPQIEATSLRPTEQEDAAMTAAAVADLVKDVDDAMADDTVTEPAPATPEPQKVAPLTPATWNAINRKFVDLEVIGDGQKAARLAVISHILGHPITRGSEMTADEGQTVLDNLTLDVVWQALPDSEVRARVAQIAKPTDPEPATENQAAQPVADPNEYDPTDEPGWGQMDGSEAAGEE